MKHWIRSFVSIAVLSALLTACTNPTPAPSLSTTTTTTAQSHTQKDDPPMTTPSDILPIITASNGTKLTVEVRSTVFTASSNTWGIGSNYPTVIELQHSGDASGRLLASFEVADSGLAGRPTCFRIMESRDGGESWKKISEVTETIDPSIEACWNPQLFELSAPLGDLPEGTLLLAGVSIDPGQKVKSQISLWKSADHGENWEQFSILCTGKGVEDGGVWEPFLWQEDGKLYCFYSDETLEGHDQAIVYRVTENGKDWSAPVPVVAADNPAWRPGMVSITKMGDQGYWMVYEVFGDWDGCPIYYKTSDSIADWDASEIGTQLIGQGGYYFGSAPGCIWTPIGGECGTLIVTAVYGKENPNRILLSFDYGKTFEAVDNPLPHTDGRGGYSASLFLSADGKTIFYANNVDGKGEKSRIDFARIGIE